MEIVDSAGRRFCLEKELFRGGEGSIHPIAGNTTLLAKLYHRAIGPLKQAKLAAMAHSSREALLRVAAWPSATLHAVAGGPVVGFMMPRFDGARSELHQLYTPASRKVIFRRADWAFLIHAARNVAAAVDTVHEAGHVIGDVNQRNFVVGGEGTVKVLDCDSFQIRDQGRTFFCEVGMPEFTPPELQGRPLAGIERVPNHDAFGLAVLCFQLLFMGRHPFAGRFHGTGEMPIERAISESRFAFGRNARSRLMEPPPGMVPFAALPSDIAALFEGAFGGESSRPAARQWVTALDAARRELTACTVEPIHKYHRAQGECFWCRLERGSGVFFFIGEVPSVSISTFDLSKVWAEITLATVLSYEPPARPTFQFAGSPVAPELGQRRRTARFAQFGAAAGLLGLALFFGNWAPLIVPLMVVVMLCPMPGRAERRRRVRKLRDAQRAWRYAYARGEKELSIDPLKRKRTELDQVRHEYEMTDRQKQEELAALAANAKQSQLQRYLERQFIRDHRIADIGLGRKGTLANWGIVTAADVTFGTLRAVQGFGPVLRSKMMAWRAQVEARFVFDSRHAIPPSDLSALEYRWMRRKRELEVRLSAGAAEAHRLNATITRRRESILPELDPVAREWAQAAADVDAINRAISPRKYGRASA